MTASAAELAGEVVASPAFELLLGMVAATLAQVEVREMGSACSAVLDCTGIMGQHMFSRPGMHRHASRPQSA